jgi:hypothetical protein
MRSRLSLGSFPVALVCAFGLAALHPSSALAQWTQKQELIASDGVYSDYFGFALAVSGDTAVVGSYASDVSSVIDAGAAYVFMFDGTQWVQKQKLTASDGAQSDNFGVSVAIDGNVIVVGSYHADSPAVDAGAAYVYRFNGTTWVEEEKLTASDAAAGDTFGRSVAVKDDVIAVGAPTDDLTTGTDAGSVYVYRYKGSFLLWQEEQKLTASDGTNYDYLGFSVAMRDHDTVLAGAYGHDVTGGMFDAGGVYEFVHSGSSWKQNQELIADDAAYADQYGYSLAVEGDTLVVGAYAADAGGGIDTGAVYVLQEESGHWTQTDKLVPGAVASYDYFGTSVAVHDSMILAGSPHRDEVYADAGAAYLFRYVGGHCGWLEQQPEFVAKDRAAYDDLGISVGLSDHGALSGAYLKDTTAGADSGAVLVFDTHEFLLSITPTTVGAGQKLSFDSSFGMPNDLVMLVVRDINGSPFFTILLVSTFTANYDWAFSTNVPPGLSGLNVTFESFKQSDPCRDKAIGTNEVTVHFQ